jgi:DNA polymerase III delta subunit
VPPSASRALLIHGEETYLVESEAARVIEEWRRDLVSEFGLQVLESARLSPERLAEALLQVPFLDPYRIVVVRGIVAARAEGLAPALAGMPETTRLLATVSGRLSGSNRLAKAVQAAGGEVREFAQLRGRKLSDWAYGRARELGVSGQLAAMVMRSVPQDLGVIDSELRKLAGAREISDAEAAQLIAGGREEEIFRLTDQLLPRPGKAAWTALDSLLRTGMAPTTLAYRLARHLAMVLEVKTHQDRGETLSQIQAAVSAHPFVVEKAYNTARGISADDLEEGLKALLVYEWEVKSGQIDAARGLEVVLARL